MMRGNISNNINRVVWTGSLFVGVGDTSTLVTSPDGIGWTSRATTDNRQLRGVASNSAGNQIVATSDAYVQFSSNGTSWTKTTSGLSGDLQGITHDGTRFIVGAYLKVFTSTNGTSWSTVTSGINDLSTKDLASTSSVIVAVGGDGGYGTGRNAKYSTNGGSSWSTANTNLTQPGHAVGVNGNGSLWVMGGYAGWIHTSTNGTSWTSRGYILGGTPTNIHFDGTYFIASISGGNVKYSTDGINWLSHVAGNDFLKVHGAASNDDVVVLVGENQKILYATK
jgi:hypothetical protein